MEAKVYLHNDKESMWTKGEELGLSDEATKNFSYALYEVGVNLDVYQDGEVYIQSIEYNPKKYKLVEMDKS